MTLTGLEPSLERVLDLAGVLVFALSGASLAARKRFDVVGVLVLATATGLGGGVVRDVLLGDLPPAALRDELYLAMPLIATAIVLVGHATVDRVRRPVLVFDAAGLGLFCVVGAAKAFEHDAGPLTSIFLGVTTAVGGGVIRDVLAREIPTVFRADSALYALPAGLGATATVLLAENDVLNVASAIAVVSVVVVLRLLALHFGWRAPVPRR